MLELRKQPADMYTAKEAARWLQVSLRTFRQYVKDGLIEADAQTKGTHLFSHRILRQLQRQFQRQAHQQKEGTV